MLTHASELRQKDVAINRLQAQNETLRAEYSALLAAFALLAEGGVDPASVNVDLVKLSYTCKFSEPSPDAAPLRIADAPEPASEPAPAQDAPVAKTA